MQDHEIRLKEWLTATGLKISKATLVRAFGWTHKFISPAGFGHTLVLYCPKRKIHVVITEPYEYTSLAAASRVKTSISGIPAAIIVCKRGTGIWNPPHCIPVLIGKEKHKDSLVEFAKLLPSCKYDQAAMNTIWDCNYAIAALMRRATDE